MNSVTRSRKLDAALLVLLAFTLDLPMLTAVFGEGFGQLDSAGKLVCSGLFAALFLLAHRALKMAGAAYRGDFN